MKRTDGSIGRRARAITIGMTVALSATFLAAPPAGGSVTKCTSPPPVYPIDQLTAGQLATGWTVLHGTTPESFGVKILGVLADAVAPGRDLILVKARGANIEAIGGMGPGFSGSPVYLDDQLVGSVSYGFYGDAHYGALTPGQDLVNVLEDPTARAPDRQTVHLTRSERRLIARDTRVSVSDVSSSLTQLPLPLAVAGATDARMARMQEKLAKSGVSVVPYRASSASSSAQISGGDPIVPGGVFTAAISYGAIAYAGVGTATIVCGDYVVAFGHPFLFAGNGPNGAALDGEVVSVIPPGTGFSSPWPFKIANIGALQGSIDQDRLSGIRGVLGKKPGLTEISSSITNLQTGRVSTATTQVALPRYLASVAWDHVYASLLSALDARKGTSSMTWTVSGGVGGQPFSFQLSNQYSGYDVLNGPAEGLYATLRTLGNSTDRVHVHSIKITGTVTEAHTYATIHKPKTASTTQPGFAVRSTIDVAGGDTLDIRVPVQQVTTGDVEIATASIVIPSTARGRGELEIYPGRGSFYIRNPGTLDQAIAKLQRVPLGSDVIIEVRLPGTHRIRVNVPTSWALKGEPDPVEVRVVG